MDKQTDRQLDRTTKQTSKDTKENNNKNTQGQLDLNRWMNGQTEKGGLNIKPIYSKKLDSMSKQTGQTDKQLKETEGRTLTNYII